MCAMTLLACRAGHAATPGAGKPVVRPDAAVIQLLVSMPSPWPRPLAQAFVKALPARIIEPLGPQTAKTIRYFVARSRVQTRGPIEYFCWASVGSGGGYAAILRRNRAQYSVVWDSLVPPSFLAPHVQFIDVDGDSTAEIVCSGQLLDGGEHEWIILRWDGTTGKLLAPRLDQPARKVRYNRLIGRSLEFADTPGRAAKTLILTLDPMPGDSTVVPDSTRVTRIFHYDKTWDGFFPPP